MKYTVQVQTDVLEDKVEVMVLQTEGPNKLTIRQMARVLGGGLSLLVKMIDQTGEMKDYELMKEIIDHLNDEFVSSTNFADATLIQKEKKSE